MAERPYTLLSVGMSIDGFIDNAGEERLLLSNPADLDRVDEVRAWCDAIMVGATTVRNDDPRLLVREPGRRRTRVAGGRPPSPAKVTVTAGGRLDPQARFFADDGAEKLVYCARGAARRLRDRVGSASCVVDVGPCVDMRRVSEDLHTRGVRRLMVEGGGTLLTQFLTGGLADELHLVVAPIFVGDARARRVVGDGRFPWHDDHRATLAEVRRIGDVVLMRYALSSRFGVDPPASPVRAGVAGALVTGER
ncbi:MAG: dihydrofolate reductase family protein [Nocardioides sp.]